MTGKREGNQRAMMRAAEPSTLIGRAEQKCADTPTIDVKTQWRSHQRGSKERT